MFARVSLLKTSSVRHFQTLPMRSMFGTSSIHQQANQIAALLEEPTSEISLRQLKGFANVSTQKLDWARDFLSKEVPKRAAREYSLLDKLPSDLKSQVPSVEKLQQLCLDGIKQYGELSSPSHRLDPTVVPDAEKFRKLLESWGDDLNNQNRILTNQIKDWIEKNSRNIFDKKVTAQQLAQLGQVLEETYRFKIWFKLLAGQYLTVYDNLAGRLPEGRLSSLVAEEPPRHLLADAIGAARAHCIEKYGGAPEVIVDPPLENLGIPSFIHVPHHLHFIMVELLKNSMRATIKKHHEGLASTEHKGLPPIEIKISRNKDEVGIRVSDQGGGMSREDIQKANSWYFTTMEHREPTPQYSGDFGTPFEGYVEIVLGVNNIRFGVGLPLATLYARINGGDLQLQSLPGYGTDAYVYFTTER